MILSNLILSAVLAASTSVATLKIDDETSLKKGDNYDKSRAAISRVGWHPVGAKLREEGNCVYNACEIYPEMKEASGTGMGFATMIWKNDSGQILTITTADSDPDTVIYNIELKKK